MRVVAELSAKHIINSLTEKIIILPTRPRVTDTSR